MSKVLKYLKPFTLSIILVVGLLVVQAFCDLSLPDYTSNIVNIGIQQNGIKNAVPNVIREKELNKLMIFMNDNQKDEVNKNYKLIDKNNLSITSTIKVTVDENSYFIIPFGNQVTISLTKQTFEKESFTLFIVIIFILFFRFSLLLV